MGFVLGLAMGALLGSSGTHTQGILSQIPLRCLYAFDHEGAQSYIRCRRTSLSAEIFHSQACGNYEKCDDEVNRAINYEVAALTELSEAAKKQATK